jgi:acyl-coenzyme A synthetase/AMP-(fatty) acid ligase
MLLDSVERYWNHRLFYDVVSKREMTYGAFWSMASMWANGFRRYYGLDNTSYVVLDLASRLNYFISLISLYLLGCKVIPSREMRIDQYIPARDKIRVFVLDDSVIEKIKGVSAHQLPEKHFDGAAAELILQTSGSTGTPKCLVHSIDTLSQSALAFSALVPYTDQDIVLHNWPHYYMAGMFNLFLCPFMNGASIILDRMSQNIDFLSYWKKINRHQVSIAYLSPTMASALLQYQQYTDMEVTLTQSVKIISTGSYLYPSVAERFYQQFGVTLSNCYGVTEVGGSISLQDRDLEFNTTGLAGKLSDGVTVKVDNEGQLLIKSDFMMKRLMVNGGEVFTVPSYYQTGDLGFIKDHQLHITGRMNEFINKGAVKIYLTNIEDAVLASGLAKEVIAYGEKAEFWGEVICINVIFQDYTEGSLRKLREFLSVRLANHEMPSRIYPVESIPRTSIGKIKRVYFE